MSIDRNTLLMPMALAIGFVLLGASNGLGWLSKNPSVDVGYGKQ